MKKKTTPAHIAAVARYNDKTFDSILVRIPKGQKEEIGRAAEAAGKSVNAFLQEAIMEKMQK